MEPFADNVSTELRKVGDSVYTRNKNYLRVRRSLGRLGSGFPPSLGIKVCFFDPIADDSSGVYQDWENDTDDSEKTEETNFPAELPVDGLKCLLKTPDGDVVKEWHIENEDGSDDISVGSKLLTHDDITEGEYDLEFPDLSVAVPTTPGVYHRVSLSCVVDEGSATVIDDEEGVGAGDLSYPYHRKRIRIKSPGAYKVRIWLRPRTIVLHWNRGPMYTLSDNAATRSSYHFITRGDGTWIAPGRKQEQSWRFWYHNLYLEGLKSVRRGSVKVDIGTDLNSGSRSPSYRNRTDDTAQNSYIPHSGEMNTNTIGVCFCGMNFQRSNNHRDFEPEGQDADVETLAKLQVEKGLRKVARLCLIWKMDPMDPNQLCTHAEVLRLHDRGPARWDILWLPKDMQADYRTQFNKDELCESTIGSGDDAVRKVRDRQDVELRNSDGTLWQSDHNELTEARNTDRVGDYLRRLVKGLMDSGSPETADFLPYTD
ncbi:MAG: N-acetylmuramoyl-L-alanine amidase [Opitutales bacterium]|nr:N-acetylmuramoyl-L-alanine amidase [Opitutales bacterium]